MARRALLRRIPGPALLRRPVHGISPAAAARFMGTKSQGGPRTAAELRENPYNLLEEIDLRIKSIDEQWVEADKLARLRLAEQARAVDNTRKIGDAAVVVAAAVPVLLICRSIYEAWK